MTTENQGESTEEQTQEQSQTNTPEDREYSPIEQEALAQGWVPKEEFEGDEARWVDAGEFVRRGELFKKIDSQNKEIKEVRKTLQALKEHYTKVEEKAYEKALAALKAEKVSAQSDGDFVKAAHIEDEIKRVETEVATLKEDLEEDVSDSPQMHPEVAAWIDRNSWYKTNIVMRGAADTIGRELAAKGLSGPALLRGIDQEIRKEFPHKFKNPKRDDPGSVEGSSSKVSSSKGGKSSFQLTDQERKVMNSLVRDKVLTEEEYIADIKKLRGD